MGTRFFTLALLVIATAFSAACGPQKTATDKADEQRESENQKTRAELAQFVGYYEGTNTTVTNKVQKAVLIISEYSLVTPQPGGSGSYERPSLASSLYTFPENETFEGRPPVVIFYDAAYSPSESKITLSDPSGQWKGAITATYSNGRLVGTFTGIGQSHLDLVKVRRE